jgi:hypothetical protein
MKYTEKSENIGFIFYSPIEDKAFLLETPIYKDDKKNMETN